MSTVVKFENISKQYRLGLVSTRTLSHDLNRWWAINILRKEDPSLKIGETNDRSKKGLSEYVWALKDINFEVKQGERVGIIGRNGAGKSTLLKLLSQITSPTTGSIKAKGRIGALLEVGTGFHPEMTGKENIYMNGSILGMRKWEITKKLDEIVDFAGVERYLDTPAKRYSSGMVVRLGFAIAAYLEPEILVVDEVLAVGDAEFQKKAIGKMEDISKGEGRTILFVSHNMGLIRQLCERTIMLGNGAVFMDGETPSVVDIYLQTNLEKSSFSEKHFEPDNKKKLQLLSARMINSQNKTVSDFDCDYPIGLELMIKNSDISHGNYCYLHLEKSDGTVVLVSDSNDLKRNSFDKLKEGINKVIVKIPARSLGHGKYIVCLNFTTCNGDILDSPGAVCSFFVDDVSTKRGRKRFGFFSTLLPWDIIS